ncbi:MAG: peroxidase-related enzyme [Pseudomonadota bacterium]
MRCAGPWLTLGVAAPTVDACFEGAGNNSLGATALGPSGLTKLEREMIAVAVSSVNRCFYCLVAHGAAVRKLSGDPTLGEALVMNYRVADVTPRQRAMLDFAVLMTEASATIEEEDRQRLRDAGFSDGDIWDIAAVASFYNMSNRMASAVDMRPNPEYHAEGR